MSKWNKLQGYAFKSENSASSALLQLGQTSDFSARDKEASRTVSGWRKKRCKKKAFFLEGAWVEFDSVISNIRKQTNFLVKASVSLLFRAQPKTVMGQEVYSSFPSNLQLCGEKNPKGRTYRTFPRKDQRTALPWANSMAQPPRGAPERKGATARAISREHQGIYIHIYI